MSIPAAHLSSSIVSAGGCVTLRDRTASLVGVGTGDQRFRARPLATHSIYIWILWIDTLWEKEVC